MKPIYIIFFLFFSSLLSKAQTGEMRVYTVAGNDTATYLGDGGPATAAYIDNTEGIWMDENCNLYISDMAPNIRIRRVNLTTGIITTIAGNGTNGSTGDGGPATNAEISVPYGLFADPTGNVYFAQASYNAPDSNNKVRKVDAITGIITTFAGGGSSLGDGGPATNAQLIEPRSVYGDIAGNIYIAGSGRIRKVNTAGIISTIAGTGIAGISGDGGLATNAQISAAEAGMIVDASGNLFIVDRTNSLIRKISASGIITTVAGSTDGYSGDGGPATNAQLSGPISIFLDNAGNLLIGDNQNNVFRKVDLATGIITHVAGSPTSTVDTNGTPATAASMHPEFIYIDLDGNIYYSDYGNKIHKITNYIPGFSAEGSNCTRTNGIQNLNENGATINIYPNPATDEVNITANIDEYDKLSIFNLTGQKCLEQTLTGNTTKVDITPLQPGIYFCCLRNKRNYSTIFSKIVKL